MALCHAIVGSVFCEKPSARGNISRRRQRFRGFASEANGERYACSAKVLGQPKPTVAVLIFVAGLSQHVACCFGAVPVRLINVVAPNVWDPPARRDPDLVFPMYSTQPTGRTTLEILVLVMPKGSGAESTCPRVSKASKEMRARRTETNQNTSNSVKIFNSQELVKSAPASWLHPEVKSREREFVESRNQQQRNSAIKTTCVRETQLRSEDMLFGRRILI